MVKSQAQAKLDKQHLRNAVELKVTMETKGWKEIIQPLINKMIQDVVGYQKPNGMWDSGSFGDKRLGDAKADRLLWYRQFGIDFNNHLFSYFNVASGASKRLKEKKTEKELNPMFESSYSNKEDSQSSWSDSYGGGIIDGKTT